MIFTILFCTRIIIVSVSASIVSNQIKEMRYVVMIQFYEKASFFKCM